MRPTCSSTTPTLYMSKRSGALRRHRTGDSSAATGAGGALQGTGQPEPHRESLSLPRCTTAGAQSGKARTATPGPAAPPPLLTVASACS